MTGADLSEFGLARCKKCRRVLTQARLEKGRCRPGNDCEAHRLVAAAYADGHPDAIAFARAVERALLQDQGLVPGEDGLTEGARGLVESFALSI